MALPILRADGGAFAGVEACEAGSLGRRLERVW
jgi:hypothetical protein